MKKLFKMSTTCRWGTTFINRVIKKAVAFCSKYPEISLDVLGRAFRFANSSALCGEEYFATSCGEFLRSSSDVQFNNIRCCISYVHELFKNTAYVVEFYVDEDFELNCKVGRAIFRRAAVAAAAPAVKCEDTKDTSEDTKDTSEDTKDTSEDTKDTSEDTKDTSEDTKDTSEDIAPFAPYYFPMPCLSFEWCHAPFDTVRTCYNCSNFKSCDTPTFSDRLQIFPAIQKNLQILPAWVYKRYNINPVLTVALTQLSKALSCELNEIRRLLEFDSESEIVFDSDDELPFRRCFARPPPFGFYF